MPITMAVMFRARSSWYTVWGGTPGWQPKWRPYGGRVASAALWALHELPTDGSAAPYTSRAAAHIRHALCVLAGNVTTILWAKAMGDFEHRLGLPGDILRPYLRQSAINSLDRGMGSLTGPFARGDRNTIDLDLEGLRGDPFREVYVALAKTFDPLEAKS